jgi:hypothetical protein
MIPLSHNLLRLIMIPLSLDLLSFDNDTAESRNDTETHRDVFRIGEV